MNACENNCGGCLGKRAAICILQGVASLVGVNLLVLVPIIALSFFCSPQTLEFSIIKDGAVSIAISDDRCEDGSFNFCSSAELYDQCATDTNGAPNHVFGGSFPRSFDFTAPAFFIRSGECANIKIGGIRRRVGVLSKSLPPSGIASVYRVNGMNSLIGADNGFPELSLQNGECYLIPDGRPAWGEWEISLQRYECCQSEIVVLICAELLLLLLSTGIMFFKKQVPYGSLHLRQSLFLASIVVLFCFYVVPLQSFAANESVFPFSAVQLSLDILPCSIIAFLTVAIGLALSEFAYGRVMHFAIFAFLVYEYLEVGLLSMGAPPFTGDLHYYHNLALEQRDLLVLVEVFVFIMVPYVKLKDYFPWMMSAFLVLTIASLLDSCVGIDRQALDKNEASKWACTRSSIPDRVCYSSKRNIIVFVIDSITSEVAKDVAIENADIAECLDGFVSFDRNLGAQYRSELSTANIFTGEYYRGNNDGRTMRSFSRTACKRGSVLIDYLESSYLVFCMLPFPDFELCYASNSEGESAIASLNHSIKSPLYWSPHGDPVSSISILTLSVFRMTPFSWKPRVFHWLCPIFGFAEEEYVYPLFRKAQVKNCDDVFLYCHTWGTHIPHCTSSDGSRHGIVNTSYKANYDQVKAVFHELAKTLDTYKDKGVYDSSTILVIADHGSHANEDAKCRDMRADALPLSAFPMLWVKPANSRGPIVFDETTPTTHSNLHKVLRALKDQDLTAGEITDMLRSDLRVFIRQTRDGYDQWEALPDMSVKSFKHIKVP